MRLDLIVVAQAPSPYRDFQLKRLLDSLPDARVAVFYVSAELAQYSWGELASDPRIMVMNGDTTRPLNAALSLAKLIRTSRTNAILVCGYTGLARLVALWSPRRGTRIAVFSDSNIFGTTRGLRRQLARRLYLGLAVRRSERFLPCSRAGAAHYAANGVAAEQIDFLPHGPSELVHQASTRLQLKGNAELRTKTLLYAGRLAPEKQVGLIIEAFENSSLPQAGWNLRIVGDGPETQLIDEHVEVSSRREHIDRRPFLEPADLVNEYLSSDALVLNSQAEPWGVVVVEALALGLPVLCPWNAGAAELLTGELSSLVFRPNSLGSLTRTMTALEEMDLGRLQAAAAARYRLFRDQDLDTAALIRLAIDPLKS